MPWKCIVGGRREVLKLLHDMKAELESDGKNDQAIYDKLASRPGSQFAWGNFLETIEWTTVPVDFFQNHSNRSSSRRTVMPMVELHMWQIA